MEKSFPREEFAAVTEKALEVSVSPVPVLLEVPEETPSDVTQVPMLLPPWTPLFQG